MYPANTRRWANAGILLASVLDNGPALSHNELNSKQFVPSKHETLNHFWHIVGKPRWQWTGFKPTLDQCIVFAG